MFMPSTGGPFPGTICVSTNRFPQYILKNLVIYCFINSTIAADSSFYMRVGIWTTASSCGGSSVLLPSAVGIAASQASLPSPWGCQTHNRYLRLAPHLPIAFIKYTTRVTKKLQAKRTQMPFCRTQQHYFNHGGFWYLSPTVLLSILHIQAESQIPQQNQMLSTCPMLWVTSLFIDFRLYSLGHSL